MRPSPSVVIALATAAFLASASTASAQNINEPEVEKGQQKIESFTVLNSGFHGGQAGDTRLLQNVSYYVGLTRWWQVKAFAVIEKPTGDDLSLTSANVENTFELLRADKNGGFGLAWFTGIQTAIDRDETNSVTFGPIFRIGTGPLSLILNPSLEKTYGQNRDPGIAFVYGWQVKQEIRKGFWLGLEGFGRLPDIGNDAPFKMTPEHSIGPLLTYEMELADKRSLTWEIGTQFGLTDATPEVAAKLQVTYTY
ncbi:MAG: hypothetical protein AB7K67_18620 [Hyphomicrobiaceae bacterium]